MNETQVDTKSVQRETVGEWGRTGRYEQAADQLHTIVPLVTSCAEMFEQLLVNLLGRQTNRHN